jgi:hypothetical protein
MVVSGDSEVCTAASSPLGPIEIEIEIEIEMSWPGGLAGGREFRHSRKTDESDLNLGRSARCPARHSEI